MSILRLGQYKATSLAEKQTARTVSWTAGCQFTVDKPESVSVCEGVCECVRPGA